MLRRLWPGLQVLSLGGLPEPAAPLGSAQQSLQEAQAWGGRLKGERLQPGPDSPPPPQTTPGEAPLTKGGGSGSMPIQGRGRKPGAGLASGEEAEPGAGAEAAAAAGCGCGCSIGPRRAAEEQSRKSASVDRPLLPFSYPWLILQRAHLHCWTGGATASPEPGEVGQAERGPWGATAGTCLEGREAGGPGGL